MCKDSLRELVSEIQVQGLGAAWDLVRLANCYYLAFHQDRNRTCLLGLETELYSWHETWERGSAFGTELVGMELAFWHRTWGGMELTFGTELGETELASGTDLETATEAQTVKLAQMLTGEAPP